jgi:hypothetical protein
MLYFMEQSDKKSHREQLEELSSHEAAGVIRAKTKTVLSAMSAEQLALVMNFGHEAIALNSQGEELVTTQYEEDEETGDQRVVGSSVVDARRLTRGWHADFRMFSVPGMVPTNKVVDGLRIPCGVVLVVGGASTAKTPMVHALAGAGGSRYGVVRYGEPLGGYTTDQRVAALDLGRALIQCSDIVFDSIKDLLAFAPGGAMSSGLSRGSFPILSDLSAIAASVGATIYVPMNPSTPDPEIMTMIVEAARSNVAMVVTTTSVDEAAGTAKWHALTRLGEGLKRESVEFSTYFDKDSELHIVGNKTTGKGPQPQVKVVSEIVGNSTLDGLFRRHKI